MTVKGVFYYKWDALIIVFSIQSFKTTTLDDNIIYINYLSISQYIVL